MLAYGLQPHRFSQTLAKAFLRLISWRLEVIRPLPQKFVLIGAPHTSSWDLLFALLLGFGAGIKLHWIGKHSLFRWPLGAFMRWLGGIPVDRSSSHDFVRQVVDLYERSDQLAIAIAPEGTRRKSRRWKTGFYYIAHGARIPVALGFIDYRARVVGIGPTFTPTGDLQADFHRIRYFYTGIQGLHPERQGEIAFTES